MGYIAQLIHGNKTFSLNDSTYSLGLDFVPPGPAEAINMAVGTFRNKTGGEVTGTKPLDRDFDFSVVIQGASIAETHSAGQNLINFLKLCRDKSEKLYLEYAPSDAVNYRPLWGQAVYRYHVKAIISANLWEAYFAGPTARGETLVLPLVVRIGPHAEGLKQRLATATGGVFEDVIGMAIGQSRGLYIPEATPTGGNQFTNPVFGNSTWNNGWTAQANLIASQNTDKSFVLFGASSARLICISDAANNVFYQSLNVANTNSHTISCYAKLPNGGDPTNIVKLWYDTVQTTTYTAKGNGWYRLTATMAGINAATASGVWIAAGYTVYVDAFQIERAAYATLFGYGDLLGWAWASTVHASASTRTAAHLLLPAADGIDTREGRMRVIVRMDAANTHPNSMRFFDARNGSLTCLTGYFLSTDDKFYLTDGTNTVSSAAQTWSAGAILYLDFVWGPGRLQIYKDGVSIASGATYTPAAVGTSNHIGTDYNGAFPIFGTILDWTMYKNAPSTAEILSDYHNNVEWCSGGDGYGQRLNPIPWLWTKDGDDQVDNCDDSTHDNWCVCGGIPGSEDAETLFDMDDYLANENMAVLYMSKTLLDPFIYPLDVLFFDLSGTVTTAADVGSAVQRTSLSTSEATIGTVTLTTTTFNFLKDNDFIVMARIRDAAARTVTLKVRFSWQGGTYDSDPFAVATSTSAQVFRTKALALFNQRSLFVDTGLVTIVSSPQLLLRGTASAGPNDIDVDYVAIFPAPRIRIEPQSVASNANGLLYQGGRALCAQDLTAGWVALVSGNEIELTPEKYNLITTLGSHTGAATAINEVLTYNAVYITPRWALM